MREKRSSYSLLLSQQTTQTLSIQKEAKVTSLNPSLTFEQINENPEIISKEDSKELNLLQTALKANQEQQEELTQIISIKNQELQKQIEENKQLEIKVQKIAQDFDDYKLFSEEQLKQKQLQLNSLQQTLEDQRAEVEKRQEQIYQLDTKVHDLSYEIKTLLHLHQEEVTPKKSTIMMTEEMPRFAFHGIPTEPLGQVKAPYLENPLDQESVVQTPGEAAILLKKCINIAQKLTGANYYSSETSRYREFSSSYFAIDQRRLFDSLRSESSALLIVYSQKENKLLFANHQSRIFLGWSPEKFLSDFSSIMHEGIQDWKKALQLVATASESQARILAKTKQGQEVLLNCHLGVIPTGLFRNYIIGVLYPA